MFAGMLLGIILAMKLCPDIPIARAMHRAFVEVPFDRLATMDRRHIIFGVVALGMLFSCAELIMLLGSSDLVMLMAWDLSLYVDAVIATWTVAAVTRVRRFWHHVKARIAALVRLPARPRTSRRRITSARPPANDADDGGAGWSYALAA